MFKPQDYGPQKFPAHTKPILQYGSNANYRPEHIPPAPNYNQYVPDYLPSPNYRPGRPKGEYGPLYNHDRPLERPYGHLERPEDYDYDKTRFDDYDDPNFRPNNLRPYDRPEFRPYDDRYNDFRPEYDRFRPAPYKEFDRYADPYGPEYPPRPSSRPQQLGNPHYYHGPSNPGQYPLSYPPNNLYQSEHSYRPTYMVSIMDSRRPGESLHNPVGYDWDRKDTFTENKKGEKGNNGNKKGDMKPVDDKKWDKIDQKPIDKDMNKGMDDDKMDKDEKKDNKPNDKSKFFLDSYVKG